MPISSLKLLAIIIWLASFTAAQGLRFHKSEAQLDRMTPEQLVEEYCQEYTKHYFDDHVEYSRLITKRIHKNGINILPIVTQRIEQYNPIAFKKWKLDKAAQYEATVAILVDIDMGSFRLRGYEDGQKAIQIVKQSLERVVATLALKQPEFEKYTDDINSVRKRIINWIGTLEETSFRDPWIRDNLWFRYDIDLSEEEFLKFINFLIAKDPTYPSKYETEAWKPAVHGFKIPNPTKRVMFSIIKNPEVFYKLYQEYDQSRPKAPTAPK